MSLLPPTREFLQFLQKNPAVRARIRAPHGQTLLYAGIVMRPAWREVADLKRSMPQMADKRTLPEVLAGIGLAGQRYKTLHEWALAIDPLKPWNENGFITWRALSGIFASQATGAVSFYVGSGVSRVDKVFAATEVAVLARNPNVDALTRDVLAYYQRCLDAKNPNLNFGFIAG
jgi:hypothetical protein